MTTEEPFIFTIPGASPENFPCYSNKSPLRFWNKLMGQVLNFSYDIVTVRNTERADSLGKEWT